jgi:hypothetical protein
VVEIVLGRNVYMADQNPRNLKIVTFLKKSGIIVNHEKDISNKSRKNDGKG